MAATPLPTFATKRINLGEWHTVTEAAQILDRSGQRVRQMIQNKNFQSVAVVGDRPTYLLRRDELLAIRVDWDALEGIAKKKRTAAAAAKKKSAGKTVVKKKAPAKKKVAANKRAATKKASPKKAPAKKKATTPTKR